MTEVYTKAQVDELVAIAKAEGALQALRDLDQKIMPSTVNKDQSYDTLQAALVKYELEERMLQDGQRPHVGRFISTEPTKCQMCGQGPMDPRHNVRPV